MSICPCCSHKLLCHISYQRTYWFCLNCGQEMPDLHSVSKANLTKTFVDLTQENLTKTQSTEFTKVNI